MELRPYVVRRVIALYIVMLTRPKDSELCTRHLKTFYVYILVFWLRVGIFSRIAIRKRFETPEPRRCWGVHSIM